MENNYFDILWEKYWDKLKPIIKKLENYFLMDYEKKATIIPKLPLNDCLGNSEKAWEYFNKGIYQIKSHALNQTNIKELIVRKIRTILIFVEDEYLYSPNKNDLESFLNNIDSHFKSKKYTYEHIKYLTCNTKPNPEFQNFMLDQDVLYLDKLYVIIFENFFEHKDHFDHLNILIESLYDKTKDLYKDMHIQPS